MMQLNKQDAEHRLVRKRVATLKPSPENTQIYRPPGEDPGIDKLAESIAKNKCDPIRITRDCYIIGGHRRREAMLRLGKKWVWCIVLPFRRDDIPTDEYIALLRDHNHQREKTSAEQVREELIDINRDDSYRSLKRQRDKSINAVEHNGLETLKIEGVKKRHGISAALADHVKYIQKVVFEDYKDFWPLAIRNVYYCLLNYTFLRNIRLKLAFTNDKASYTATAKLITRLRLKGEIPWEAFDDFTRPFKEFRAFGDVREYIRHEQTHFLTGYWRDLLQTQPNHIEVVCEKNTVYHMVLRVTEKYHINTSSGRGFNSIDPWHDLYERYMGSGKRRLIVVVLSDYDPEGEMITHTAGRTLRDDFGVPEEDLRIIKAGVTREQIQRYNLPPQNFAKDKSPNFRWFLKKNGGDNTIYELEALAPAVMLDELDKIIHGVIDVDLFNREVEREREDSASIEAVRRTAFERLFKDLHQ
jgi:hypothetical protein